jgi:murein DD-endopeptidase MepM/ murein hydrolase activator NlpD
MGAAWRSVGAALVATCALAGAAAPATATAADAHVAALQVALRARGLYAGSVDGLAGPATAAGVRALQAAAGLPVDGIAGPATHAALGWRGRPALGARPVAPGARGWDVAQAQFLLARAGFPSGPFDGAAGPRFAAAVQRFQAWAGLPADGVAGALTVARLRAPPPVSPIALGAPVGVPPTDGYGPRGAAFHTGLDFPAPQGAPVHAAGRGCATFAGFDDGYGLLVVLGHGLGVASWYAHLSRTDVRPGQCVAAGATIGAVGATGRATGPHLHFEVRVRGATTDPRRALR